MQWSGLDRFAGGMRSFAVGGNRGREDEELGGGSRKGWSREESWAEGDCEVE